jgi:hypothetical protein
VSLKAFLLLISSHFVIPCLRCNTALYKKQNTRGDLTHLVQVGFDVSGVRIVGCLDEVVPEAGWDDGLPEQSKELLDAACDRVDLVIGESENNIVWCLD